MQSKFQWSTFVGFRAVPMSRNDRTRAIDVGRRPLTERGGVGGVDGARVGDADDHTSDAVRFDERDVEEGEVTVDELEDEEVTIMRDATDVNDDTGSLINEDAVGSIDDDDDDDDDTTVIVR